jgi:transposase InsO family protein
VRHVQSRLGVSERRACKVLGQPRSTQRYTSKKPKKDRSLVTRIEELAGENPRSGYRQITALLRREGWQLNQKRVHRLWREGGHQVPRKQHKRRRLGTSSSSCVRLGPAYKNHVWSYHFIFDSLEDGRATQVHARP